MPGQLQALIFDGTNPVQMNLQATKGGVFPWFVELIDVSADAIDMSATAPAGWSSTFLIAPDFGSTATLTVLSSTATGNGSRVTFPNLATGQVLVTVAVGDLALLSATAFYVFELKVTDNNGVVYVVARGLFYLNAGS